MAVEQELLKGISLMKEGKEEGFNIFYSYTHNFVYSRARMIMDNEEDALDLTQETFLQAYKGISSLKDPNAVYAWLNTITHNHGMKIFKKQKHESLVSEDTSFIFDEIINPDIASRPDDFSDIKETANILQQLLDELPAEQKASLVAFYYDELKISEIAALCDCSENTIKSRLRYAKETLKNKVTAHEKQNRYKLCSLTPTVLFMASEALLTSKKYTLSPTVAKASYATLCNALGLLPTALTTAAGATIASGSVAVPEAAASGLAASGTVKSGMSITVKIIFATIATTGTLALTTLLPQMGKKPYADEMAELIQKVETNLEQYNLLESNVFDIETSVKGAFTKTEDETAITTAKQILTEILTPEMSQFEQVKAIHDYMVINFDYDYLNSQSGTIPATSYTAEGMFSTSRGVSAGYAKTFELLCDCAGIETKYIVGTTYDGLQIWNQVKVDNQWYNIDVTMDDPFTEGKLFDYHLENRYSHFMLSDADISHGIYAYYRHTPLNNTNACTTSSICNAAYDYGCPWLENNTTINYVTSKEQIEAIMLDALKSGNTEFMLFVRNDQFSKQTLSELAQVNSALGDYHWEKISRGDGISYTDNFFTNWYFSIDSTIEKWPILSSSEEIKNFMINLDTASPKYTQLGQANVYLTGNSFDFEEISKWAILNGCHGTVSCTGVEYANNRYSGIITIHNNGYKKYTSPDEIITAFEEAYSQGKEYCDVLFDFRNANMTHNDATYVITMALSGSQVNAYAHSHSILSEQYEGLLLYRLYFR